MKTTLTRAQDVERKWYVVDASDQIVGRLASKVAAVLRGKHKPTYTPNVDTGDYVIIVNAEKVKLSGNKENKKVYRYHTKMPGGVKTTPYAEMKEKHPERILGEAIRGMLPKGSLGREMYKKLKIYAGPDHKHQAQMPEELKF